MIKVKKKPPVDERELYVEVMISKGRGKLTKDATNMFIKIANNASRKLSYRSSEDQEDCLQTAMLTIFSNWRKFNPDKSSNVFSYFTEIFKRGSAFGWDELFRKKGDPENKIKVYHIHSANDGDGIYSI